MTNHPSSVIDHPPDAIDHLPNMASHRSSMTGHLRPVARLPPSVTDHPPGMTRQHPNVTHHASSEIDQASAHHRSPSKRDRSPRERHQSPASDRPPQFQKNQRHPYTENCSCFRRAGCPSAAAAMDGRERPGVPSVLDIKKAASLRLLNTLTNWRTLPATQPCPRAPPAAAQTSADAESW